ncbi:hypothetical protein FNV43_RR26209 [Rhamnella rubrinervis]|uniref:EF-hand domain-containing protein n=1 Tax=Rhamnella rubrinervis TaxID=2594499 RepID=A0A8K0DNV8_9ROSA|nr:hypothetical protein FNV43_RR26209 [Rhamnella rubrinervis]
MEYMKWLHLFLKLLLWHTTILNNVISNVKHFVSLPLKFLSTRLKVWTQRLQEYLIINHDQYHSGFGIQVVGLVDGKLSKEEVEMVMRRLGICYAAAQVDNNSGTSEEIRVGEEELKEMFKEDEPNLEELKEAFDVFDEDKDGFIEAADLQRVLCRLGLVKDSGISKCVTMIKAVDKNEDGLIDFNEFVRFMENC